MATLENLRSQGWHITSDGLNKLGENESSPDSRIIRKALDVDIRDIGAPVITSLISRSTFGPVVLQIVKIRNIAAPKNKPNSQSAPRMLKLVLTDGHANCQGIEIKSLPHLSFDKTTPGTKIYIEGAQIVSSYILLEPENCRILGGCVSSLVEKWEVSKMMPNHVRVTEDGPPAWVNFGKKIISNMGNQLFKSLENKNKENTKENAEFQVQRQDAIAEAAQGAVKKVFGGGVKPMQTNYVNEVNASLQSAQRPVRQLKNKGKEKSDLEKSEKPSQRVSLFDFLEDKLNFPEPNPVKNSAEVKPTPVLDSAPPKPKPDYSEYIPQQTTKPKTIESYPPKPAYKDNRDNKFKPKPYNAGQQDDNKFKYQPYQPDNRFQNDKPPRFQKQKPPNRLATATGPSEQPRTKPNTNNFVDKLTHEINNISLYNNKYENERLHRQSNRLAESTNMPWRWKIGDRCMAKYWEDNKFYNAIVTGLTDRTCMVEFIEYGNFEEVLHCDCIPITNDKQERQHMAPSSSDNRQFSGNLEFRRGKNRPYVQTPNRVQGQNYNYNYES